MAASDHLEPKLFHGSAHWFGENESVQPGRDTYYGSHDAGAYATEYLQTAKQYSASRLIDRNMRNGQMEMLAPVYEVEHLTEHSDPENKVPYHYRRDEAGFRPKKIVAFATWKG